MNREKKGDLRRILLVEDEIDIQMVARLALEDVGGFEVEVCSSGEAALEAGPNFRPQLILLDFMMPGMDGRRSMEAFRKVPGLRDVPVAFITARAQIGEVAEYRELGAVDVIVKPFDPMKLADLVLEIWRKAHPSANARTNTHEKS
jgi:two-component system OmpR family response regulator